MLDYLAFTMFLFDCVSTATSNYTCIQCGTRYCSTRCLGTHQETRSAMLAASATHLFWISCVFIPVLCACANDFVIVGLHEPVA